MRNRRSSQISENEQSGTESEKKEKSNSKTVVAIGGSPLKQFTLDNPEAVKHEVGIKIKKHDKIYLLEVPKSLDEQEFLGKSINIDKKTKIKLNHIKYVIEPSLEDVKPITLLTKNLQIIHPVARLELREHVKQKNDAVDVEPVIFKPSLPENLKVRHPLFGAEYKNKIVLSEEIERKLDNTIDDFMKKMKKKKKHKEKKAQHEEEIVQSEPEETIFTLLESHRTSKKKKRHQKENDEEIIEKEEREDGNEEISGILSPDFSESQSSTKKKKKKYKAEASTDNEETEREEKKKQKKINIIEHLIIPSTVNESNNLNKTKKKKHKNTVKTDAEETEDENHDNRKNKKTNIVNSTVIPGLQLPSFEFDISGITNNKEESGVEKDTRKSLSFSDKHSYNDSPSKKKKKKKENSFEGNEYETQIESSHKKRKISQVSSQSEEGEEESNANDSPKKKEMNESTKKKRKKEKVKEAETNHLIMDILSKVKNEMDTSSKSKKKTNPTGDLRSIYDHFT